MAPWDDWDSDKGSTTAEDEVARTGKLGWDMVQKSSFVFLFERIVSGLFTELKTTYIHSVLLSNVTNAGQISIPQ